MQIDDEMNQHKGSRRSSWPISGQAFGSAEECAESVSDMASGRTKRKLDFICKENDIPSQVSKPRPTQMVKALKEADRGKTVEYLETRATQLKGEVILKSSNSVISGLRMWHFFACDVLGYTYYATLPPASARDVVLFVSVFSNAGTAANYIYYIRYGCKFKGHSTAWCTDEVRLALKGLKKENLRMFGGPARTKFLLKRVHIMMLYKFNVMKGNIDRATTTMVGWFFLLRLQSEGLVVWKGAESDLHKLPDNRDNGLFVDSTGDALHFVLRTRKHRQEGSRLKIFCTCHSEQFCLKCDFEKNYNEVPQGQTLWEHNSAQLFRLIKEQLRFLGVAEYNEFSWKSFRAGKATEMANDGFGLGQILLAGEWRSVSFLRYLDIEKVNPCRLLCNALDESDGE